MPRSHRTARSLAAVAILLGSVLGLTAVPTASAAPTTDGTEALTWLAGELAAADGLFEYDPGFGNYKDYGLTLDAVLALALGGTGTAAIAEANGVLDADGSDYITGGAPDDRFAGAIGKLLLARQLTGASTTVDGLALETELRARLQGPGDPAPGAVEGRFRDDSSFGDFSNGFTQAFGVLALARTSAGVPASAVAYLLDQQCPNGGFRLYFDVDVDPAPFGDGVADPASTDGCEADGEVDVDATAMALQALLAVPTASGAGDAITKAVAYLNANPGTNTNTRGLVGQALRGAGSTAGADAAATAIAARQFPSGAIALDPAGFAAGEAASSDPTLWRNTAQGALALGLPTFGFVAPPATTTTTVAGASTTSTTAASGSTSSTSTTLAAGASTTSTSAAVLASSGNIPRTGTSARTQLAIGLLLLGLGSAAYGQSLLRERRSS